MNRGKMLLMVFVFAASFFAGCAGKSDGDGGSNIDESLVYDRAEADTGYRVTGSLAGNATAATFGTNASSVYANTADAATLDDAAGAIDQADFVLDVWEADGTHIQAGLRSMVTGADAGLPDTNFYGGVNHNFEINGDTGIGTPALPKTKAFLWLAGMARVLEDGQGVGEVHLVTLFASRGVRDATGALQTEADQDLEFHVIFPGSTIPGNAPLTVGNSTDEFVYYYFERVTLKQLSTDEKAAVGGGLSPPRAVNVPPVAVASLSAAGAPLGGIGTFDAALGLLNVTMGASNSTDADGAIEAFSWQVFEQNTTGVLEQKAKLSGVSTWFNFTTPGLKRIDLRVIDALGGIGNTSVFFYLDYRFVFAAEFAAGGQYGQSAGGGQDCQDALNCLGHSITVGFNPQLLKVAAPVVSTEAGRQCNTAHWDVTDPGGTMTQYGTSVTLDAAKLAGKTGRWDFDLWWTAQVKCKYTAVATVQYSPLVAAAP